MDNQEGFGFAEVSKTKSKSYTRYAYRLETKRIRETDFPYIAVEVLNKPEKVASFARSLQDSDIEKMLVLYLDTKMHLICIQVTTGTIDRQIIWPREILKHALLAGAKSIVMVHNHPSGDPESSPEDKAMTRSVVEACKLMDINVHDHLIIGSDGKYFSFSEKHIMPD